MKELEKEEQRLRNDISALVHYSISNRPASLEEAERRKDDTVNGLIAIIDEFHKRAVKRLMKRLNAEAEAYLKQLEGKA